MTDETEGGRGLERMGSIMLWLVEGKKKKHKWKTMNAQHTARMEYLT